MGVLDSDVYSPPFDAPSSSWAAKDALADDSSAAAAPKPQAKERPLIDVTQGIGSSIKRTRSNIDTLEKQKASLTPPTLNLPPKPTPTSTDIVQQWGSLAMAFAALASLRSRTPMTTALNAAAGVMKGFQQNDKDATDRAYKTWEEETKNALEIANFQQRAYDEALAAVSHREDLEIRIGDEEERTAEAKVDALNHAFQSAGAIEAFNRGGLAAVAKYNDDQKRLTAQLEIETARAKAAFSNASTKADTNRNRMDIVKSPEFQAARTKNDFVEMSRLLSNSGDPADVEKYRKIKDENDDVQAIVAGMKNGEQPPDLTRLYGKAAAVRAEAQRQGLPLSKMQMQWQQAQRQVTSLNGPQMVRFVGVGQSVVNTINEVKNRAAELDLGTYPLLNKAQLAYLVQTQGDTKEGQAAAQYLAAVNTLREEFANLAEGGYAPTEPVFNLANTQINENYGVAQMNASLDEIQRLINYRLNSIPGLKQFGPGSPNPYTGSTQSPIGASEAGQGVTITNPETGERLMLAPDGESWIPLP
jgi:hypothetical protein